jgi:hypothetical protein
VTLRDGVLDDLDDPDWLGLFENVQRSWFRLETLQVYSVEYERDEYDRFIATGRLDRPVNDWQKMITRHTEAGRTLQRVHIVVEPLSNYLRYEVAAYQLNDHAGEDIRLIPVSANSWPEGLPTGRDFWLFDDREVWDMHYDPEGRFLKATRSESPEYLQQCRSWRDIALSQAIPLADYLRAAA